MIHLNNSRRTVRRVPTKKRRNIFQKYFVNFLHLPNQNALVQLPFQSQLFWRWHSSLTIVVSIPVLISLNILCVCKYFCMGPVEKYFIFSMIASSFQLKTSLNRKSSKRYNLERIYFLHGRLLITQITYNNGVFHPLLKSHSKGFVCQLNTKNSLL